MFTFPLCFKKVVAVGFPDACLQSTVDTFRWIFHLGNDTFVCKVYVCSSCSHTRFPSGKSSVYSLPPHFSFSVLKHLANLCQFCKQLVTWVHSLWINIFLVWPLVTFSYFCTWRAHLDSVVDTEWSIAGTLESAMFSKECWFCLLLTWLDSVSSVMGRRKSPPIFLSFPGVVICLVPWHISNLVYNSQAPRTVEGCT